MLPGIIFHLIMLSLIGACVLGCGIAAGIEIYNGDQLCRMARETRRKRKRITRRRAELNAIRYSR